MYCKLIGEAKESSLFINPAISHNCFKLSKSLILFQKLPYTISSDFFKIILKIISNILSKIKKNNKIKIKIIIFKIILKD